MQPGTQRPGFGEAARLSSSLSHPALFERADRGSFGGTRLHFHARRTGSAAPVAIGERNAYLLRGGLEEWIPDVLHRKPFVAVVEDGHAVAVCASVRISTAVHCAGVETRPEYRHRGQAVNAAAGWGRAVRARGATPFYSTSWENIGSQRVAERLGLTMVAVDFSIT